jgi:hypothetical protein
MSKIVFDDHSNLLREDYYKYTVQDVAEPNLFRRCSITSRFPRWPSIIARFPCACPRNLDYGYYFP